LVPDFHPPLTINNTPRPFGFSEAARKVGEGAVAKDIGKVFATPDEAFTETGKADPEAADRFWAHVQNRRFARARKALAASASPWHAHAWPALQRTVADDDRKWWIALRRDPLVWYLG
jgi:hypothetical protein